MPRNVVFSFLLIAGLAQFGDPAAMAAGGSAPRLAPGQVWSIKSSSAKIIVGRIEPWAGRRIVHVSLIDVPVPGGGLVRAGGTTTIGHMPFDESSIAVSVDRLLATDARPDPGFENGYKQWQDAKGGVFTISVEQAIEVVFQGINRRQN